MGENHSMNFRIGQGFDVHKIVPGDGVILGGVKISANIALEGYSDADVLLHAVTDALLGAIGERDIGTHFPPGKEDNKNRDSREFLQFAIEKMEQKGYSLGNIDITVIAEKPKINPYYEKIHSSLKNIFQCKDEQVSLKATTTEKLGFTGREEGIAALAVILVHR